MSERDVIDAKFEVVRPAKPRRWYFDWRNFLIVGALAAIAALRPLIEQQ